jgi:predicted RNA-binding Zn ribbon-like protein
MNILSTCQRGVDQSLDTSYTGVMNLSVKPDAKSISKGEWARFIFISGRLCIDFTQTGGETGNRAYWERFHQPSDLADWFAESPLQMDNVHVSAEEFETALSLREAIWRAAEAIRQNKPPLPEDVSLINRVASTPDLPPQLIPEDLEQAWYSPATAAAALSTIARDAIDLFSSELRFRIRVCENSNCGLMFVDTSRPGKRRWCLMKRCGNMAKTSQYRKSKKHHEHSL